jgi:hypothetical protein
MPPEISNQEAIQMMNRCKEEILSLRAIIERLQPKADAYDNLATVLRLLPQPRQKMGEDLVWTLKKRIEELQPKPEAPAVSK